jgi:hypothetical protein
MNIFNINLELNRLDITEKKLEYEKKKKEKEEINDLVCQLSRD